MAEKVVENQDIIEIGNNIQKISEYSCAVGSSAIIRSFLFILSEI